MPAHNLTEDILAALSEAAVEIANLSSPDNIVCRRLRHLQTRLLTESVTAGELAQHINVAPRDVLDAAAAIGIRPFWHEEKRLHDASSLRTYLKEESFFDPANEIAFDLTPDLTDRLALELGVSNDELRTGFIPASASEASASQKSPRKFTASESKLPSQANAATRRAQNG